MTWFKTGLGALAVILLLALRYPAGAATVVSDAELAGIAFGGLLGVCALAGVGWLLMQLRCRPAAAPQPYRWRPPAPCSWPTDEPAGALPCASECGRPAECRMVYEDGRPDVWLCGPCRDDTAASEPLRQKLPARPPEPTASQLRASSWRACRHGIPAGEPCNICDSPGLNTPAQVALGLDMTEFENDYNRR